MDNRLNISVHYEAHYKDRRMTALYEKIDSNFRVTEAVLHKMPDLGGYDLTPSGFKIISDLEPEGLNVSPLTPIHEWLAWYYFTLDPPLVWKNSSSFIEIDIPSILAFFLSMFLSAATVYLSTRCLRHRIPTTTGFGNILWDFVASFFFEPFPSDWGILSVRLVLAFWLLGITIFCNEVNGVFKGKMSVKEYAVVETEEDLDRLDYKSQLALPQIAESYTSYKYGKGTGVLVTSFAWARHLCKESYVSKKKGMELLLTQTAYLGKTESRLFEYDPRIREIIVNWALRLYEGSTGRTDEEWEFRCRLINLFDSNAQLFTPYEVADLSVPFRLLGYGLAAAIVVKLVETILLAIYNNKNKERPKRKPQLPE